MRIERAGNSVSDKLRRLTGKEMAWIDLFSRSKRLVTLKIRAEEIDFARADVFIGDINKKTRGAFAELNVEHLVHILYDDFLQQVREFLNVEKLNKDTVTLDDIVDSLIQRRKLYFPRQKRSEVGHHSVVRKRWAILEVQLLRENAQRGEVFLYDASTIYSDFEMTLEELMSILFVDFIAQLRRGNQQILVNTLLDKFYSHDFD
ncbi:hypothetical protein ACLBWT_18370 [Paenibacillus sp. D51F]